MLQVETYLIIKSHLHAAPYNLSFFPNYTFLPLVFSGRIRFSGLGFVSLLSGGSRRGAPGHVPPPKKIKVILALQHSTGGWDGKICVCESAMGICS